MVCAKVREELGNVKIVSWHEEFNFKVFGPTTVSIVMIEYRERPRYRRPRRKK